MEEFYLLHKIMAVLIQFEPKVRAVFIILCHKKRSHKIYNAFLLPYGKTENENNLVPLGKTTEDWYDEEILKQNEYLQIRAIRLDTKSLMYNHSVANDETLSFLVELIKTM